MFHRHLKTLVWLWFTHWLHQRRSGSLKDLVKTPMLRTLKKKKQKKMMYDHTSCLSFPLLYGYSSPNLKCQYLWCSKAFFGTHCPCLIQKLFNSILLLMSSMHTYQKKKNAYVFYVVIFHNWQSFLLVSVMLSFTLS